MYAPSPCLRPILTVPSLLYEAGMRIRNGLYTRGLLHTRTLDAPVISVGNLTLGGTGKTPLVIHVADLIVKKGATPVLLTRGYRRSSRGMRIVPPDEPAAAGEVGDEPALVRRRCPAIWLGVHHDRYAAGIDIARVCRDPVFILDDGFQHRALHRDLDVVVIDTTQPLGANRIVPLGTLREPAAQLRRADMVILTGGRQPDCDLASLCPQASILTCAQQIPAFVRLADWRAGRNPAHSDTLRAPVFLVAALGNPNRFLSDVQAAGLEVGGTHWLRDHSPISPAEWLSRWRSAQGCGAAAIVTTEKDAVKITEVPDVPIWVALQSTRIVHSRLFEDAIAGTAGGTV